MKLVFPMVMFALCLGLFSRRLTSAVWAALGLFVAFMIAYVYIKPI